VKKISLNSSFDFLIFEGEKKRK